MDKAELFAAVAFAKSPFAKFALFVISQNHCSQLSLSLMSGDVSLVIAMSCYIYVLIIGLCLITSKNLSRKSTLEL